MKLSVTWTLWFLAIAGTVALCLFSGRVYELSTCLVEPASVKQLILYAANLDCPSGPGSCLNCLRQIDGAKQQWALEHKISDANAPVKWQDVTPYLLHNKRPWCPKGGVYILGNLSQLPKCSVKGHALPPLVSN
jgi:hypothetical protein